MYDNEGRKDGRRENGSMLLYSFYIIYEPI